MTPLEIRRLVFEAARTDNNRLALLLCKEMQAMDAFIGEPAKPTGHEKFIPKSEYPGRCGSCGQQIPIGGPIYWGKGVGQWHPECYEPASQPALQANA